MIDEPFHEGQHRRKKATISCKKTASRHGLHEFDYSLSALL